MLAYRNYLNKCRKKYGTTRSLIHRKGYVEGYASAKKEVYKTTKPEYERVETYAKRNPVNEFNKR